jgi:hypothetical protein
MAVVAFRLREEIPGSASIAQDDHVRRIQLGADRGRALTRDDTPQVTRGHAR